MSGAESPFVLHERLEADTVSLGQSKLCEIRLMNDSNWPWILLVPRLAVCGRSISWLRSNSGSCWRNRPSWGGHDGIVRWG